MLTPRLRFLAERPAKLARLALAFSLGDWRWRWRWALAGSGRLRWPSRGMLKRRLLTSRLRAGRRLPTPSLAMLSWHWPSTRAPSFWRKS